MQLRLEVHPQRALGAESAVCGSGGGRGRGLEVHSQRALGAEGELGRCRRRGGVRRSLCLRRELHAAAMGGSMHDCRVRIAADGAAMIVRG